MIRNELLIDNRMRRLDSGSDEFSEKHASFGELINVPIGSPDHHHHLYVIHTRECDEQTKTCRRSNKNVHMLLAFAYHTLMTTLHLSTPSFGRPVPPNST